LRTRGRWSYGRGGLVPSKGSYRNAADEPVVLERTTHTSTLRPTLTSSENIAARSGTRRSTRRVPFALASRSGSALDRLLVLVATTMDARWFASVQKASRGRQIVSEGIGAVLTFAIGVAISPVPIIAVILMLFSARARVNGLLFLLGWAVALGVVSGVAYALSDAGDVATDSTAADSVAWGKIVIGVLFLLLALRQWRSRPAPDAAPVMPRWMAGIDSFAPGKAFTIALLLAGVNPKNLLLSLSAGAALAQTGVSSTDALVSVIVYVIVGSITILAPVVYHLVGGDKARTALDSMKAWLTVHNAAVMMVLFLVFGAKLIADGLPALGG